MHVNIAGAVNIIAIVGLRPIGTTAAQIGQSQDRQGRAQANAVILLAVEVLIEDVQRGVDHALEAAGRVRPELALPVRQGGAEERIMVHPAVEGPPVDGDGAGNLGHGAAEGDQIDRGLLTWVERFYFAGTISDFFRHPFGLSHVGTSCGENG